MEQGLGDGLERCPMEFEIHDFFAVFTEWGYSMESDSKRGDDSTTGKDTGSIIADPGHERISGDTRMLSLCAQRWTGTRLPPFDAMSGEQERLAGCAAAMELADDHGVGCCTDGGRRADS